MPKKSEKTDKKAGKKTQKKPERKEWKFLIFWKPLNPGEEGRLTIEKSSRLPKSAKEVGAETTLEWKQNYDVKVIQKGLDEAELEEIGVDCYDGTLLDPDRPAFSADILSQRTVCAKQKRLDNKAISSAAKANNCELFGSTLFAIPKGNQGKAKDKINRASTKDVPTARKSNPPLQEKSSNDKLTEEERARQKENDPPSISAFLEKFCSEIEPDIFAHSNWNNLLFLQRLSAAINGFGPPNKETELIGLFLTALTTKVDEISKEREGKQEVQPRYIKLPDHYFQSGPNKVQLFPGQQFFIHSGLEAVISSRCVNDSSWQHYSSVVLGEVYGDQLKWLCCSGKRGGVGVHSAIRNGLKEYAKQQDPSLKDSTFGKHVNRLTSNRRSSYRRKKVDSQEGDSGDEDESAASPSRHKKSRGSEGPPITQSKSPEPIESNLADPLSPIPAFDQGPPAPSSSTLSPIQQEAHSGDVKEAGLNSHGFMVQDYHLESTCDEGIDSISKGSPDLTSTHTEKSIFDMDLQAVQNGGQQGPGSYISSQESIGTIHSQIQYSPPSIPRFPLSNPYQPTNAFPFLDPSNPVHKCLSEALYLMGQQQQQAMHQMQIQQYGHSSK